MVTISVMTEKDTKFAAQLTDKEKWGHKIIFVML